MTFSFCLTPPNESQFLVKNYFTVSIIGLEDQEDIFNSPPELNY